MGSTKIINIAGSRNDQDRKNQPKIKIHLGRGNGSNTSQEPISRKAYPQSQIMPIGFGGIHKLMPLGTAKKV